MSENTYNTEQGVFQDSATPDAENFGLYSDTKQEKQKKQKSGSDKSWGWLGLLIIPCCCCFLLLLALILVLSLIDWNPDDDPVTASIPGFSNINSVTNNGAGGRMSLTGNFGRAEGEMQDIDESKNSGKLKCNNKEIDVHGVFNKGLKKARGKPNGASFKNPKTRYMCSGNKISVVSFTVDYSSGDPNCYGVGNVLGDCAVTGVALTTKEMFAMYAGFIEGSNEQDTNGVTTESDSETSTIVLSNTIYEEKSGTLSTYNDCVFDRSGVMAASSAGCITSCCLNNQTCAGAMCVTEEVFEVTQILEVGYTDTFLELKKEVPQMTGSVWPCADGDDMCIRSYIVRNVSVSDIDAAPYNLTFPDVLV